MPLKITINKKIIIINDIDEINNINIDVINNNNVNNTDFNNINIFINDYFNITNNYKDRINRNQLYNDFNNIFNSPTKNKFYKIIKTHNLLNIVKTNGYYYYTNITYK
jgi:hypothetical protein